MVPLSMTSSDLLPQFQGHNIFRHWIEGLRERTEYIDIFLFFRPSLNHVLFPMFCLLVEGECQILVF